MTGAALFERRIAFRTGAAAGLAGLRAGHDDFAVITFEGLFERNLDVVAEIAAAFGTVTGPAPAA